MRYIVLSFLLLVGLIGSIPADATSLFDEDGCDLFTNQTASELGDIVTIIQSCIHRNR